MREEDAEQVPLSTIDTVFKAFELLPLPAGYVDDELIVRACTPAAGEAFGVSVAGIVGHSVRDLLDAIPDMLSAIEEVLSAGTARTLFVSSPGPDRKSQHWEVNIVPDLAASRVVGAVVVGVDISDLVDAQLRVAESERLYRSIGELLPYGMWTAAGDGALTYLSDSFVEMTGRSREALLGWGWLDLLATDEDRRMARASWEHSISGYSIRDTKHTVRAKDGSVRHVLCRGIRIAEAPQDGPRWAGVHVDVTESERRLLFRESLNSIKDLLVSSLDTESLLKHVAEAVLSPTSSDFAAIVAPHHGQWWEVRHTAGSWGDREARRLIRQSDMPLNLHAFESGQTQVAVDAGNDPRMNRERAQADGLQSIVVLPVKRHGAPICLLVIAYTTSQLNVDPALMDFLSDLSDALDLALQGAAAHEHQRHISETLQQSLLALPEHLHAVEFAHLYEAAIQEEKVGGDFYDAFEIDGRIAVLVGDVSGSGLEAAALTALAKNTIRAHLLDGQSPASALTKANRVMHAFTEPNEFATVFVGLLDPPSGSLVYACAGHPPPFAVGVRHARPITGSDLLLGALEGVEYADRNDRLQPDETLLMYTDGITEARSKAGFYGEERLVTLLGAQTQSDPGRIVDAVFSDARSFANNNLGDDVALLAIRVTFDSD